MNVSDGDCKILWTCKEGAELDTQLAQNPLCGDGNEVQ